MKKALGILMCLVLLVGAAIPSMAQRRYYRHHGRTYVTTNRTYYTYQPYHRSFWQKHRDKLTLAGGTLGGAMIGGIAGGRKGAGIGALVGAGSSALYTYKLRNRHHHYYRY